MPKIIELAESTTVAGTDFLAVDIGTTGLTRKVSVAALRGTTSGGGSAGGATYAFVTDANYAVTTEQAAFDELEFSTGAITAPRTVTFPHPASKAAGRRRTVFNDSVYALTVSTGTGSSEVLLPGQRRSYWFDNGGVRLDETATNVVSTSDATPAYRTLATLALNEVRQIDVVAVISKADGTVRQTLKWSGLVYGAAGPVATFDTSPGPSSSLTGTGTAVLSVEVLGAIVRLKIVGVAATALSTKYDVTVL
ncbi:MAG TPA: hypothetical protein VNJ04_05115 [Gemmatimonadaceae bacterium]|nr:hypothetical protein [Gemmatimonadaceae bacterium]